MLYQEGWGLGTIKHSLTSSGGLSRSYARTYAPARHCGFDGFSPFTRPNVIEQAEGIPFHRAHRLRRGPALRVERRDRQSRRKSSDGIRHAGVSQAPLPAWGRARGAPVRALRRGETDYHRHFLAMYN
jgi:asparagine synthase (glutamine-hydrolysing)